MKGRMRAQEAGSEDTRADERREGPVILRNPRLGQRASLALVTFGLVSGFV
ncbi:MAG: hypothetical protein QOI81_2211, partial [Actinomycetota bacterium]|nr:hypothetical protein [Actinomycetota bacterium]